MTRRFLFLQGPPGPFFRQLATELARRGHAVLRVNFNGGDQVDWRGPAIAFRGALEDWDDAIGRILDARGVTDLVLFGDCRALHRRAIEAAAARQLAVHVFEEGYVRPDFVTLERDGVNGHSRLPGRPERYLAEASLPRLPMVRPLRSSRTRRYGEAIAHYGASWLLTGRFTRYRSHRPFTITAEARGWLRRLLRQPLDAWRTRATLHGLRGARYFVLPLQLDSDHQLRVHSPFTGMAEAIRAVLASFAAHAAAGDLLVVKDHPLDNGLVDWRALVRQEAAALGVGERVRHLPGGDIAELVTGALGVVTVNSTTGTLALAAAVPVKVLGRAVYDVPGITHQGPLDAFWQAPGRPQLEIFDAFRRVLARDSLLRGAFSSVEGRRVLVPAAAARLLAAAPSTRAPLEAVA
jgi:capsular polysaccharide export protein